MHHAYPRECSYPHMSGTTRSITPLEYKQETGEKASIAAAQASQIIKDHGEPMPTNEDVDRDLPWSSEEELFVCKPGLREGSEVNTAIYLGPPKRNSSSVSLGCAKAVR